MSELGWLEPLLWVGAGAGVGAAVLIGVRALVLHRLRASRLRQQARTWERVMEAADALADPMLRPPAGRELLRLLNSSNSRTISLEAIVTIVRTRPESRLVLRQIVAESRVPTWLTAELSAREHDRRTASLELIAVLELPGLGSMVASLINDEEESVRAAAGRCLARIDAANAVGVLIGRLESGDRWASEPLSTALAGMGDAIDLDHERMSRLAPRAASTASQIDSAAGGASLDAAARRTVARLVPMLASPEPELRIATLTALGDLQHPMAAMALAAAIGSGDRVTRFAAGIRLTETPTGVTLLRDLARRDHGPAGDTARVVLWGTTETELPLPGSLDHGGPRGADPEMVVDAGHRATDTPGASWNRRWPPETWSHHSAEAEPTVESV
ncbi:MAG: hypothetical protein GY745_22610 [Actinomycetia bacterium]|nr:hypothetical protein [Actinomycetes bacterium]